jgi:DNA-binding NarL/FixJ family response regulator
MKDLIMSKKTLKSLVIEDDFYFRSSIKSYLEKFGPIMEADNTEVAKKLLATHHFDMAVIDINLNDNPDGLEPLKLAKAKNIYSVILTY